MGGMWGEVRGRTKIETYLKYVEDCEGKEEWSKDPDPAGKKYCYRQMERDEDTGEWVLEFHLHT